MHRLFIAIATVALALCLATGGVAAQAQNASNETTAAAGDDYQEVIDEDTRITNWQYSPGQFLITIQADASTSISLTEAGSFDEGTSQFNYGERELEEGENVIRFSVTDRQGAAVAIATRQSLQNGGGAIVSTGAVERNPMSNFGGESGLLSGIAITVAMAGLGALYVVRSEDSGVSVAS
ncbi:hypothetical protein Halru_2043 [Halovivax ruber XH-70]|uniref:Uncharacterized protein n=1 Tax=Halovivax ruber (strain DSM 18193 / JCM 13892 / XH-70) TaxID=797302 RepID=L0IF83_HALRX|nr:hypothetical protein [Halovivax ruber]AGB16637.1 hypothetical protein Halru_2043 [Halovivax ruber XH-70]